MYRFNCLVSCVVGVAACLLLANVSAEAGVIAPGGVFTNDATSGIGTYGRTGPGVNINGAAVTVNGVTFQADSSGGNPSGTLASGVTYSYGGLGNVFGANSVSSVSGNVANLANSFVYDGGGTETLTLGNLIPGQVYVFAQYNFSFGDNVGSQGSRIQTITDQQNAVGITYDENSTGGVGGNILLDTFTPTTSTFAIMYHVGPGNSGGDSFHQYDFQLTAVPEPSTAFALLGLCGMGLAAVVWRRRKAA
jgi:hypothetical protein